MKKFAPAKVNLALNVNGVNDRGYHDLDMIMVPLSLCDEIDIELNNAQEDDVEFIDLCVPDENTVTKALRLLREKCKITHHYTIKVVKNIPEQAGLAGGSADAAAVLSAINELEGLDLSKSELIELGQQVGADVPFCLINESARVQGIGEKITRIDTDWCFDFLLVKPNKGVSTPLAFKKWDEGDRRQWNVDAIEQAMIVKDHDQLMNSMVNALEEAAIELVPEIADIECLALKLGADRAMMTGSGSAVMIFSKSGSVLQRIEKEMKKKYPFVQIVQAG
ncbi:4-(cytidine 5'-diphospho)-2-C-methyl-D-erythritol kinase [Firmicutes bacterium M10-2]|nr:4-(cytidine 5'-diphospho)-2-C-methyl-D-erythritol kinase [Firmicutes bacterium M10-2]